MRCLLLMTFLFLIYNSEGNATPNLFVPLKEITLVSKDLTLTIYKDPSSDRISGVKVKFPEKTYQINSTFFQSAYGVNLQGVELTQSVDFNNGLRNEYQLYIPYILHSIDGSEPLESQELIDQTMIVHFNQTEVTDIMVK
ncbi:hypothetical protein [Pseudoalteromonas luteoviolacea]|uniref:Uncharacterized protein n=1 Tax=Pseudoalteromonas luteoviolacea DSM 6061 TaxID=1365250 RepID=A0A167CWE9_9GAMM|nr:hypothetical protein [Pseudoalteromonas luteoviolacea]KZN48144.1 hypothetical protein N475_25485 [Pseudoalteromonas luteoviolacea DSM 6061]MBE0388665.1 hypothetical protein [Pseudoalteromonas luteoviolacea DSM 6061]